MLNRRDLLKSGVTAATVIGLGGAVSGRSSHELSITDGTVSARYDSSTGKLAIAANDRVFAIGDFIKPGRGVASVHTLPTDCPFGEGRMIELSPDASRLLTVKKSPFIFIRRDPRAATSNLPANQVSVFAAALDIPGTLDSLRAFGAGGLFKPRGNPGQHVVTAIADPATRSGVVAGLVQIEAASGVAFTSVQDGKIVLHLHNQYGSAVPPELGEFGGDWWAIGYFEDVREGLEIWADEFARINKVKLKREPTGYCTWYSEKNGGSSDQVHLIDLADCEAKEFKPFGFNFVQIDDGWQGGKIRNGPARQFWHVNPHGPYSGGMKPVTGALNTLGLVAGLWMLPFGTDWKDPACAFLLPLVVRRKDGTPYETAWGGTSLDMTNPKARAFVSSLISRAVHQWGFNYLKLDGLYTGLAVKQTYPNLSYVVDGYGDAVFFDKRISNMQAARMGLHTVRKAAGEEAFILGCCTPQNERSLGMTLGLVNAMRIGPDNDAKWDGMMHGVYAGSRVYFLNGRVWWNDPDPTYARVTVPRHEFLCYGSWVTLAGFLQTTSDWTPGYSQQRIKDLRCMMPSHQLNTVRPVDLLENDPPRVWILRYMVSGQQHDVLGLFNWSDTIWSPSVDRAACGLINSADYHAYDFWGDTPLTTLDDLAQPIPAHSCRVIALRKALDHPQVVSTSRHVTQGAVDLLSEHFDASSGVLSGTSVLVADTPYTLRIAMGPISGRKSISSVQASSVSDSKKVKSIFRMRGGWALVQLSAAQGGPVAWQIHFNSGK